MSLELTLSIPQGSPAEQLIEQTAQAEHLSREEAALKLIERGHNAEPEVLDAYSIIGAGREDAALIDEIMELIMAERLRMNAEPPRDL